MKERNSEKENVEIAVGWVFLGLIATAIFWMVASREVAIGVTALWLIWTLIVLIRSTWRQELMRLLPAKLKRGEQPQGGGNGYSVDRR